jgi:hypothetical protein
MELHVEHADFQGWERLVGTWSIEARHLRLPREVISGLTAFEWLADQHFLLQRAHYEHPEIPDAVMVSGVVDGEPAMYYFDPRGVHRTFSVSLTDDGWRYWNDAPSFAQRFAGTFSEDGTVITGSVELCQDGETWTPDLEITYRRADPALG